MTRVAVVAHAGKSIEGGLPQLRRTLAEHGVDEPLWAEVDKSRRAPKQLKRLLGEGADLFFVWGGDGMAQRSVDVLAGTDAAMAIVPAGTANLLATNLGVPGDIEGAVATGLRGRRRRIDAIRMNGERFAVMAGAGFDADMIRAADGGLKDKVGRAAYLWTGAKSFRTPPFTAKITVDDSPWFSGRASCILAGNVGALFAGVRVFEDAEPDDGLLDIAVVTADGVTQWARTVGRTIAGTPDQSPFFRSTKGRTISVKLDRKVRYELDGGDRSKIKSYDLEVEPRAVTICVPAGNNGSGRVMSSIDARARTAGRQATHSAAFEVLTRIGFLARGAIYVIIGLLAIQVAIHAGNETTNQRGAMRTIEQQPFGHWLLIAVAVGLAGYSAWRFVQAFAGAGPEGGGDHSTFGRIAAAASGCAYAALCVLAVTILLGSSSSTSSSPHKQTAGVLGWPGGQYLVGAAGALFVGVALYQGYKGLTRKFLDEDKTDEMGETTKSWLTVFGVIGYLARMVAFGLIGIFLVRAAVDYDPSKAVGLDGALARLAHQSYGSLLLGLVAAGLIAFGLFSIAEARYRRI